MLALLVFIWLFHQYCLLMICFHQTLKHIFQPASLLKYQKEAILR